MPHGSPVVKSRTVVVVSTTIVGSVAEPVVGEEPGKVDGSVGDAVVSGTVDGEIGIVVSLGDSGIVVAGSFKVVVVLPGNVVGSKGTTVGSVGLAVVSSDGVSVVVSFTTVVDLATPGSVTVFVVISSDAVVVSLTSPTANISCNTDEEIAAVSIMTSKTS